MPVDRVTTPISVAEGPAPIGGAGPSTPTTGTRSWKGDYVLRAALYLAARHEDGRWVKAREIAEHADIPRSYVAQIVGMLIRSHLVNARAGPSGGYRLVRAPDEISLLDVVDIDTAAAAPPRCILRGVGCGPANPCAMHDIWAAGMAAFQSELAGHSLAQVAKEASAKS